MKKLFLLLIISVITFAAIGCVAETTTTTSTQSTTQTLAQLSTPTNITVADNVLSFDSIDGASSYLVAVTDVDQITKEYELASGFDLSYLYSSGNYSLTIVAVGDDAHQDSAPSASLSFTLTDANPLQTLSASTLVEDRYVRWVGRTYYDTEAEVVMFYYTGSGFVVNFYGTSLDVTFYATNTDATSTEPIVVAFVDDEVNPENALMFPIVAEEITYTIVSGLPEGFHTVKLLKRSEAIYSNTGIISLATDGMFVKPEAASSISIQFIGASSQTGYGDLAVLPTTPRSNDNSDGLRAYAYLVATMFKAEESIVAASGWGVTRGYNTGGAIDEVENMPNAFDYVAIDDSGTVRTDLGTWDQTAFVPDVIVLNVAGNDFSSTGYSSLTADEQLAIRTRFVTDYTAFLIKLQTYFPDATIICVYGLTNDTTNSAGPIADAITAATAQTQTSMYTLGFDSAGTMGEPFGSDYHPSVGTQAMAAQNLADYISELMGWSIVWQLPAQE